MQTPEMLNYLTGYPDVKSEWIACVDAIKKLEMEIASAQSLLKLRLHRKSLCEKELLKNDDGVTAEEKHAYLLGIYYDPDLKPKYSNNPETRKMREELLKLEKDEREEKRRKLTEELNNFSDEFVDKLLALLRPVKLNDK